MLLLLLCKMRAFYNVSSGIIELIVSPLAAVIEYAVSFKKNTRSRRGRYL